jgi:hypothetical protein
MTLAAACLVFPDLLFEPVTDKIDGRVHGRRTLFGLDEKVPEVEHDVDDLIVALGAQGDVRVEDAVIYVVIEMADLLFSVLPQGIGDAKILSFDKYLHWGRLMVMGLGEFRLAKMCSCTRAAACAVRCVSNQARAAPSATMMTMITMRATTYGPRGRVLMIWRGMRR